MSPARQPKSSSRSSSRGGFVRSFHRALIAAEALLVLGVVKDWIWKQLLASSLDNWMKVVIAMLTTIGLLGGLYVVVQRFLTRGMAQTHKAAAVLPFLVPTILMHAGLLYVLFLLYARMLGVKVW